MDSPPTDTDVHARRIQAALLREAGPARRAQLAWSLSAQVITLARQGLRERHGGISADEAALRFVELYYGAELASGLRRRLSPRRS